MSAQPQLDALGAAVARQLDAGQPARLARQRARLVGSQVAPRRGMARWVAAAAVVAALVGALRARSRPTQATLSALRADGVALRVGDYLSPGSPVRFSDGSSIRLSPGANARIIALAQEGAEVVLERGSIDVSVHHAARTRWRLHAGPWVTAVTGTEFRLGWSPLIERFELDLRRGRVRVSGPGLATREVREGERLVGDRAQGLRARVEERVAPVSVALRELARVEQPVPAVAPRRELVRAARRRQRPEPPPSPEPPPTLARRAQQPVDAVAALAARADRARYEGRVSEARSLLLELRARHPGTAEARRAAHLLGVVALEAQRAPAVAARWFEIALRETPRGALRSESLGRRVQALHAAGDRDGARAAAARYLREDPDGAFAPFAREVLAR